MGVTADGKPFRPIVMAAFGGDHRMQYSPFVNFAKDNELKVRDGRTEVRTRLAELQRVGDTA